MPTELEMNQYLILKYLTEASSKKGSVEFVSAKDIQEALGMEPLQDSIQQ